jgi:hypothetical protein
MDNLTAGIWLFLRQEKRARIRLSYPASESLPPPLLKGRQTSPESVAAFVWNQWQACRGMGGSFAMESVADFVRNTHMRILVKRILRKYGYPPDLQDAAVQTVLQQAEVLSARWAA